MIVKNSIGFCFLAVKSFSGERYFTPSAKGRGPNGNSLGRFFCTNKTNVSEQVVPPPSLSIKEAVESELSGLPKAGVQSIVTSILQRTLAIMVPTGKVGPITPRKIMPEVVVVQQPIREPAGVWERVDEGPNPYQPPVYKYTLLDFARKYGRKTLIPPPEEEYYRPRPRVVTYHHRPLPPAYYKTKFYYSPLQSL